MWVPAFYLFWRAIVVIDTPTGGVWALLAGSIVAMLQFFLGYLIEPGGFGLSRWVSGCVDIVSLPALLPLLIYLFLVLFKIVSGTVDFANFALLWLIPCGAIRALGWSSLNDPLHLLLVPILWTAIATGIPFFMNIIQSLNPKGRILLLILACLGIAAIPFAAASSYWAFYAQKVSLGILLFIAAALPMLVSVVLSFIKAND